MAYNRFLGQNGFRGVDFTSHPSLVNPDRLADALNVWRDYKSGQGSAIETFPGFRRIAGETGTVYGLFRFRVRSGEYLLAHIGKMLFYYDKNTKSLQPINDTNTLELAEHKSQGFQFGDYFYIVDSQNYLKIRVQNGVFTVVTTENAYIPTTFINGVEHEQRNMLLDYEIQQFSPLQIQGAYGGHQFTFGDFDSKNKTCSISKCTSDTDASSVVITPSKVTQGGEEYDVIKIGASAFFENQIIKKVILTNQLYIGTQAFYKCENLEEVVMTGLSYDFYAIKRVIGDKAFAYCSKLRSVYVSPGKEQNSLWIGTDSFLGSGINTDNQKTAVVVVYQINGSSYLQVEGTVGENVIFTKTTNAPLYSTDIHLPLYSKCKSILSLSIDDRYVSSTTGGAVYYTTTTKDGIITEVIIHGDTISVLGKTATVKIEVDPYTFYSSKYTPFLSDQSDYDGTAQEAILNCTVCAQFDGRVFFTGNPNLPNTVFYTQRDNTGHNNPFYIGTYNYFDTGIGQTPNTAMISSGSNLIVFKGDTIQDGSINLYQGVNGTDDILPRYYVRQQGLAGVGCLGAACNFADDSVFISKRGLDAVGLQTVNLERTVQHRSTNVDRRLTAEDLSNAQLTEWEGYLVLLVPGGKVYLADSRQVFTNQSGYAEYEWYYLNGFGSYLPYAFRTAFLTDENGNAITSYTTATGKVDLELYPSPESAVTVEVQSVNGVANSLYVSIGDKNYPVYRTGEDFYAFRTAYPACAGEDDEGNRYFSQSGGGMVALKLYPDPESPVESEVYSANDDPDSLYVIKDGKNYPVYKTGEKENGGFSPATCIAGFDEYLLFGTENGDVCVVNTDKRGEMPENLGMSEAEYKALYGDIIPRQYYSHMDRRYLSYIYLAQENAGVPHMVKNTVKRSCVLKAKDIFGSVFKWNVKTDRQPFSDIAEIATALPDFNDTEFGSFVFDTSADGSIIALNEKKKRYVEKQYAFFSDDFCRPFGIYHISYQYEIQGKVKNR